MSSSVSDTRTRIVALLLLVWSGAGLAQYGLHSSHQRLPGVEVTGPVKVRAHADDSQIHVAPPARLVQPVALNPSRDATKTKPDRSREELTESADGWVTIKSEDFEGSFPNEWTLYGTPTWDDETYRAHAGSWSGYCVGSSVTPPGPYPSNASSWMVYGPFSLVDAADARVTSYRWLETEASYDFLEWRAAIDGTNFYGWQFSGTQDWTSDTFDLKTVPTLGNLCGQSQVWIAFRFASDETNEYEGAYVDDIVLEKYTNSGQPDLAWCQPTGWDFPIVPSNVTGTHTVPSPLPAGTTYIDWAGTNAGTAATSDTFYIYLHKDGSPIQGWFVAPPVAPGDTYYVEDYATSIAGGSHTLMTMQDSTNCIAESNETNNRYAHSWTWDDSGVGPYEHVTITSSALSASFAPLKSFLLDYLSLHDTVITTEYIYANQGGRDNPEKIRNFIKYAYQNWQTSYVLLGGDAEVVPLRKAYPGKVTGDPPWNDTIPCDLYYSGLDGSWDGNSNNVFGEMDDSVDMAPEVYVGRAPVSNSSEAARFVSKTTTYGQGGSQHRQKVLLTGFDYDTETYGEQTMDYYDDTYINSPFACRKVYDSYGGSHEDSVRYYLNQGYHYYIHGDHGGVNELCTGNRNHNWGLSNSDMSGLANGFDKLTVFTTSACLVGAFDQNDCVMEAFMNAANGGAVATMTNSRYGWYSPRQNPQTSFSHTFVEEYVDRLFSHGTDPGETKDFLLGKADIIGQATTDTTYRWCMYDYNLFGEPALKMVNLTGIQDELVGVGRFCSLRMTARPAVFSRFSTIEFGLGHRSDVRLDVYDAGGRQIRTLLEGTLGPGRHSVHWDGRTGLGGEASAGLYMIGLRTDAGYDTRKVIRCAGKEQQ